jgi:hypothetical protein
MSQAFGKRNRPDVRKPERAKLHKRSERAPPPSKSRFHLYVMATILLLVLAGYAFAH